MPANAVVLVIYDASLVPLDAAQILGTSEPEDHEWAAQCVAFETLRTLILSLMSVEDYNNMSDEDWEQAIADSRDRADLIPNVPVDELSESEVAAAANIGGNYFEHTYDAIMEAVEEEVTFTKLGGIQ